MDNLIGISFPSAGDRWFRTRSPAVVRFQEEAWQELLLQNY